MLEYCIYSLIPSKNSSTNLSTYECVHEYMAKRWFLKVFTVCIQDGEYKIINKDYFNLHYFALFEILQTVCILFTNSV